MRYITTALEIAGVACLTVAAALAFGLAGLLAAVGVTCVAASYVLSGRGSA